MTSPNTSSFRILCLTLVLLPFTIATAQERVSTTAQVASPAISVVAATDRVRISAPNSVVQMHVEIYGASGQKLFDTEIRGGNVFDWHVQNGQAERVAAGDYVCVVTVKNIGGQLTQRIGAIRVGQTDVRVETAERVILSAQQSQAIGPVEEDASWTIVAEEENQTTTVIAHDGTDGQIIRGRGAFSFRLGDFFSGKDKEQMRLSEEGNLGIGTARPEFKLDVAGAIRAREGFVFNDGSTLTVNEKGVLTRTTSGGSVTANIVGAGTQGRLAKWTDNAGTVGDSVVVESSGNIGIGVSQPGDLLDIAGPPNGVGRSGIHVRTTSSSGNATLYFDNDRGNFLAYGGLLTGGSVNANAFFGVSRADKTFLIADGPASLGLGVGTLTPQPLLFGTSNTERMRITPSGNVGIATDPGFRLDVNGRIRLRQNGGNTSDMNSSGLWLFQNTPNVDRAFIGMKDDDHVGFYGNNGAGWRLLMNTQTGNVGVGTVPSSFRRLVVEATGVNDALYVTAPAGHAVGEFGPTGLFLIDSATSGGGRLTVDEFGTTTINFSGNPSNVVRLIVNGYISANTLDGGGLPVCQDLFKRFTSCASSMRYKTNVRDYWLGLGLIRRLRPVYFNWKETGMNDMGLIAEQVADVEPLLTFSNDKGQIQGVKYDRVAIVLVNAVKQQQVQIERQHREIQALKRLVCSKSPGAKVCKRKDQ